MPVYNTPGRLQRIQARESFAYYPAQLKLFGFQVQDNIETLPRYFQYMAKVVFSNQTHNRNAGKVSDGTANLDSFRSVRKDQK